MLIDKLNNYLPIYIISSFYLGALLFGPTQYNLLGLNTTINDYFLVLWIFILMATKQNIQFNIYYIKTELLLLLLFMVYAGFETLHGMYGAKSLSLYIQLLRSFVVFILVLYFMQKTTILQLNRFIFKLGFWMSVFMLFLYGLFLQTGYLPLNIFEYGEFQSIRFEGLAGDANFYAFLMSVSFLIGYYTTSKELNVRFKSLYLLFIGISVIIPISRSVIASLIVSFIFVSFVFEKRIRRKMKKLYWFIVSSIFFIILSTIKLPIIDISIYEWYALRSTQSTPRFEYWAILYNYFLENSLFGYGLRASEVLLGGFGEYAHSSYVELFVDYGIFGAIIFLSFMLVIFIKGLKLIKLNKSYMPWVHSYIILCMLFAGFTILYWAFLWTTIAIILGGYIYEKNRLNNNILQ